MIKKERKEKAFGRPLTSQCVHIVEQYFFLHSKSHNIVINIFFLGGYSGEEGGWSSSDQNSPRIAGDGTNRVTKTSKNHVFYNKDSQKLQQKKVV